MKLYLVQHGAAKSKDEDPERPLTERGRKDVEAVCHAIPRAAVGVSEIAHSGKTRARQTAEILAEQFRPRDGVHEVDGLDPLADPAVWAERLSGETRDRLLVGHLPHLNRLASLLVCGDADRAMVAFRQGGVVCLTRDEQRRWSFAWAGRAGADDTARLISRGDSRALLL